MYKLHGFYVFADSTGILNFALEIFPGWDFGTKSQDFLGL